MPRVVEQAKYAVEPIEAGSEFLIAGSHLVIGGHAEFCRIGQILLQPPGPAS